MSAGARGSGSAAPPGGGDRGDSFAHGLVLMVQGELVFVEIGHVSAVLEDPWVSEVPGAPFGMALVQGQVVAVLKLGAPTGQSLLCVGAQDEVLLQGVRVLDAGRFPRMAQSVLYDGRRARVCTPLDFMPTPSLRPPANA